MIEANWTTLGINIKHFPPVRGSGRLLVVGGGRCVWDDFNRLGRHWVGDVMTINDITMHFPIKVKHAYSNDKKMLPKWVEARRPRLRATVDENRRILQHSCNEGVEYKWPFPGHGSSGLNACYVGLGMGYEELILIGIPLDNSGHYWEAPWLESRFLREVPPGRNPDEPRYWENAARKIFDGRVKSMSGRTRELLGEPG